MGVQRVPTPRGTPFPLWIHRPMNQPKRRYVVARLFHFQKLHVCCLMGFDCDLEIVSFSFLAGSCLKHKNENAFFKNKIHDFFSQHGAMFHIISYISSRSFAGFA